MSTTFPGFASLYRISDPFNRRAFRGSLPDQGDPWRDAWVRGERLPDRPVRLLHAMGSKTPQHCVWTTSQALILHKAVVEEMNQAQLTGWTTYEVELPSGLGSERRDYFGFAVVGRCGEIDYSRGTWSTRQFGQTERAVLRGIAFDENSWDGSDFFAPSTPGLLHEFCTAAGRALLGRFGNVEFTALTDFEIEELSLPKNVTLPRGDSFALRCRSFNGTICLRAG